MGHGRVIVVGAYAGAVTPQMAARMKKAAERQALLTSLAQGPSVAEEMAGLAKPGSVALVDDPSCGSSRMRS
ncbi:hypothetical protein LP416_10675 [Polaromonas sp. P2-4]|nr:hypothetical protein LP416_10675 [Polaromonas sp. P2-4]